MNESTVADHSEKTGLDADGWNELFDVLVADCRRKAFLELADFGAPLSVDELAQRVFERRDWDANGGQTQGDESPTERIQRLRIELYHVHLPKLAAANLVTFDHETGRVSPGERTDIGVDFLDELL
ncbi:DUF7344 domain-containing protein [Haloprofundus halobius]|uniref:DUF7344 domain-containing protein n=1 Tax=Haloprofundus halobius TaxID=2876194 RepID=UPI001CCE3A42|nr:hypothetical protein [Haloprofundus halobius]